MWIEATTLSPCSITSSRSPPIPSDTPPGAPSPTAPRAHEPLPDTSCPCLSSPNPLKRSGLQDSRSGLQSLFIVTPVEGIYHPLGDFHVCLRHRYSDSPTALRASAWSAK